MEKVKAKFSSIKKGLRNDANLSRARHGIVRGAKTLHSASGRYMIQKIPVVQWLPKYSPQWLAHDLIAGISVGFLLIPQALTFAALAGIPLQVAIFASWLPSLLYVFMGTSKDLSTGPTSVMALLTGQVIAVFSGKAGLASSSAVGSSPTGGMTSAAAAGGFPASLGASTMSLGAGGASPALPVLPPALVAAVVAFSVGILSLIVGLLKLGWLFDVISMPVLMGFITGITIPLIQGQVPVLLGETGVSNDFLTQGPDIIKQIGTARPRTIALSVSSIVLLVLLQLLGKKWGSRSKVIKLVSISKSAIVLILFTGISYGINKDLEIPLWDIVGTIPNGLQQPTTPPLKLVSIIVFLGIPVFIAAAIEHVTIATFFGQNNGYAVDQSQELVFLGLTNMINGVLGGMPVSGSLSTSAINSGSGVKSPLGGLFSSGFVLFGIFLTKGALLWIPKASLSAVIVVSVVNILPPGNLMGKYWRTSFVDFVANFFTTQFAIVATGEQGIGIGVAFMVAYTLIRTFFARARPVTRADLESHYGSDPSDSREKNYIPSGIQVMNFSNAIMFLNARRIKQDIVETVQTYHTGIERITERKWNDLGEAKILSLRRMVKLAVPTKLIPRIRVLVLDLTQVTFIDTTGIDMLREVKAEMIAYGGENVEIRFVGLNDAMKKRFERAGWELVPAYDVSQGIGEGKDALYELLKPAIEAQSVVRDSGLDFGFGNVLMSDSGSVYEFGDEEKGKKVIITQVGIKDGKPYKEA